MIIGIQAIITKLKAFTDSFTRANTITTIVVTNSGTSAYVVNGSNNATLSLYRGVTYIFEVNASGHPFWIQTSSGAYNAGNVVSSGVTNNGAQVGNIIYQVPDDAPSTLYYVCQNHSAMAGTINITGTSSEYGTSLKAAGTKSWKNTRGVWGILSNKAKTATSAATYPLASINTGSTYATAKIGYGTAATHGWGVAFWLADNANWYAAVTDRTYVQTNYQAPSYSCSNGGTYCGNGADCARPGQTCGYGGHCTCEGCNSFSCAANYDNAIASGWQAGTNPNGNPGCDYSIYCFGRVDPVTVTYSTAYLDNYTYFLNTIKSTAGTVSTLDNFTYIATTTTSTSYLNYVQVSTDTPTSGTVRLTYQLNNGSTLTRDVVVTSPAKAKSYGIIISQVNATSSAAQASDVDNFEYTPLV